jgi:hypothetical protein
VVIFTIFIEAFWEDSLMRRLRLSLGAMIVFLLWAGPVTAAPITLNFEGLQDHESINNYYSAGFGSLGSGPGPNYGVSFLPTTAPAGTNSDAEALIRKFTPPSGPPLNAPGFFNFLNNPSGDTIAFFLLGTPTSADVINVKNGFSGGFSFYYSQQGKSAPPPGLHSVNIYSGVDGTGTLLATIDLVDTGNSSLTTFDSWAPASASFVGTAKSILFAPNTDVGGDRVGFDDITFGSQTPSVPEPASIVLLGLGGAGMIGYRWRDKRTKA